MAKLLDIIGSNNRRITELIEQLLSFFRLDAGQLRPNFQHVDLADITREVVSNFAPAVQVKRIHIDIEATSSPISADRDQIRTVLSNLVDNAVKYTPEGGRVDIRVGGGPNAEVVVTDTGIVISERAKDSVFEEFFRIDQPKVERERGTGLGLAIVGGSSMPTDAPSSWKAAKGGGSTFRVVLAKSPDSG